ncbi:MAG: hypothetical protein DMF62_03740 [Acidobacteria bacterium]|nr:MAG: hypothetical protein DMF62_03740 [Acidobacteriota bacterium]
MEMKMADFKSLLSKRVDDAERPAILPVGTYEGVVVDYQPIESNTADRTPQVRVNIRITAASDGIEAADLVDAKGKPIRVADRRMRHDFWLDEENQWKLSEFIRSCGVETAGRSFGETLPEVKNAPVFVQVNQTPDKQKRNEDGSPIIYNNIARLTGQAGAGA